MVWAFKTQAHNYFRLAYGHTWIRKFFELWDAKCEYAKDDSKKIKPMLLGDKLFVFGTCLLVSPCLLPKYIVNDLNKIDIYMKGQKQSDYGNGIPSPKKPIDFLLS